MWSSQYRLSGVSQVSGGLKDYLKGVSIGFVAFVEPGMSSAGANPGYKEKACRGTRAGPG